MLEKTKDPNPPSPSPFLAHSTFDERYGDGCWGELGHDQGKAAGRVHDIDGQRSSSEVRSKP